MILSFRHFPRLMNNFFLFRYGPEILLRTGQHVQMVLIAISIAVTIGLPLGVLITRQSRLAAPILGFANVMQTVPSLALFGFLLSVPLLGGIGNTPAIVALILYSLLPIIRNTYTGITQVNPAIREAGRGMGMTDWQLLTQVELPLAMAVILSGVRIATVIAIGIATIAPAIGAENLGVFIFRGIAVVNNQLILAGAIPAAIMALVADLGIDLLAQRFKVGSMDKPSTVS